MEGNQYISETIKFDRIFFNYHMYGIVLIGVYNCDGGIRRNIYNSLL